MPHFKVLCGDCGQRYEQSAVARPVVCGFCGGNFIAVKELVETPPSPDIVARVRALHEQGMQNSVIMLAFELQRGMFDDIVEGKYGEGEAGGPDVIADVAAWVDEQRRKKVIV